MIVVKKMITKERQIMLAELRLRLSHRRLSVVADLTSVTPSKLRAFQSGLRDLHPDDLERLSEYFRRWP